MVFAGPLPGAGRVTLRAATLADEQLDDAEAACVCRVPLPYTLPPTRYAGKESEGDTPWTLPRRVAVQNP